MLLALLTSELNARAWTQFGGSIPSLSSTDDLNFWLNQAGVTDLRMDGRTQLGVTCFGFSRTRCKLDRALVALISYADSLVFRGFFFHWASQTTMPNVANVSPLFPAGLILLDFPFLGQWWCLLEYCSGQSTHFQYIRENRMPKLGPLLVSPAPSQIESQVRVFDRRQCESLESLGPTHSSIK